MKNKSKRLIGISVLLLLVISFFIKIRIDEGANYYTESSLLGALIFYNPFILGLYILIAIYLIVNMKR